MKKNIHIAILIMLTVFAASAQTDHYLRCVSVENNDSIRLTWVLPTGAGEFTGYDVYHSNSPTNGFSLIAHIDQANMGEYVHQNSNPAVENNYYFIKANNTSGVEVFSDTLAAIKLRLQPQFNNSIARLDWNLQHDPTLPSSIGQHKLYRKYSYKNWVLLYEGKNTVYIDTIQVCPDSINYKIEIENNLGCFSVSNISGTWLQDLTPPSEPILDSVSLVNNGNALLGWDMSKDSGTVGYIIYRKTNIWPAFDTVFGLENTSYKDSTANGCLENQSYSIAAFDSCGNVSGRGIGPENLNDSLRTILLHPVEFNPCDSSSLISWTPYINMIPALSGYKIYMSKNGSSFELLETIPPDQSAYLHQNLESPANYSYFIRAYNADMSSSSCIQSIETYYPNLPDFIYLRKASVTTSQEVLLSFYTDSLAPVAGFLVFRSDSPGGPYDLIDTVQPSDNANIKWIDLSAQTGNVSYYYRINVLDSCGKPSLSSNMSRTILLNVTSPDENTNRLNWNAYEGWDGTVGHYDVYRLNEMLAGPMLIGSVGSGTTTYQDNISGDELTMIQTYFVEAIEATGSTYPFADSVRSNMAVARQEADVIAPNAFAPKGLNNKFKPLVKFIEPDGFSLRIYDRWGKMIFETHDPGEGWDGKSNGSYVPMGVYIYLINFRNREDQVLQRQGTVTVIY
ncbi:MAG: gliding motility-associated C-terminal domain-containing protein [Bacteroidales bacterium]|nr:gliding motility-associated C-terminal domain-containing protein [Bacteroidales bacterium]MCF8350305.1 gliding motility-associated C-terminal domain-containing protein [Bacteroidales bacterium]MCF8374744.1 gliding motility-associated C-terminal domain-containing protein [Bacteroidales bacterium]MCF8399852.1 gliding motility-associated C-terminal domain-containing protein [Bacteroidales bacterium]